MTTFQRTAMTYRPGALTLPGSYYTADEVLAEESARIFARQWNCVGRSRGLAARGKVTSSRVSFQHSLMPH